MKKMALQLDSWILELTKEIVSAKLLEEKLRLKIDDQDEDPS
jgi:hypothetical protein